jgi:Phosphotransferase enzyme family
MRQAAGRDGRAGPRSALPERHGEPSQPGHDRRQLAPAAPRQLRPRAGGGEKISWMQPSEMHRAVAAAMSAAAALGLAVDDAIVLHDSNRLAVRLLPCDVLARVAPAVHQAAQFEVELAQRLAETESPVAALEPRVAPRAYERDGFAVSLWTYYNPVTPREVSPAGYANALERLHAGMRKLDVRTPHFTDRVAAAQQLVESSNLTPELAAADRELLISTLRSRRQAIGHRGAAEQLLHGEPHPGNVLNTKTGLLFIDLETCCRGPVEFDLAHVPEDVSERYPDADEELLSQCRALVLAMVAAWRWDPGDQFPDGQRAARELLSAVREGPPWPALDVVMRRQDGP